MAKWFWPGLSLVLVVALGATLYKFLVVGETHTMDDGRVAIELLPGERDAVLAEMRDFLVGVQAITAALSESDMKTVAEAARARGMVAAGGVPAPLMRKLPMEFKQLGLSTHQAFDQLALDAEQLGDPAHTGAQLGEVLSRCVSCHAAHRLDVAPN